jgi:hypothetical protein
MIVKGMTPTDLIFMSRMVEQYGVTAVLCGIAAICHDKATSLIETQDKHQAGPWVKAGDVIEGTVSATDGWPS